LRAWNDIAACGLLRVSPHRRNDSGFNDFPPQSKIGRNHMLKTTLYNTAVAGGLLAAATVTTPATAAPAVLSAPAIEKNVTDVQHRHHRRHRHHRHHHHHHYDYYAPGPGIFFYGPRYYHW
jgi:hypothetical protein